MTTPLDVLSSRFEQGRIQAQVPQAHINLNQENQAAFEQWVEDFETIVGTLIQQGVLAWKVANPKPGMDKVLYTPEARNPTTNRLVNAYLWMTPLAVAQYDKSLYALYEQGCEELEKKWTGAGTKEDFETFRRTLLLDTVPVAPAFQSQVPDDIKAILAPTKPVKAASVSYGKRDAQGFAERISVKTYSDLDRGNERGGAFLAKLDNAFIGPKTKVGKDNGDEQRGTENIQRLAIAKAGALGVDWLLAKGFSPSTDWYQVALNYHRDNVIPIWDHLAAKGVDPRGHVAVGTLWHSLLYNLPGGDASPQIDWLRTHSVDWHVPNPGGELPAARLLGTLSRKLGQQDFFGDGAMGKMLSTLIMGMAGGAKELADEKAEDRCLEKLLMDMVADGVDLTQLDKSGHSALASICPEQGSAERYLAKTGGGHLFNCDHEALKRAPAAYGTAQLAFLRRLEKASGLTLLDDPSAEKTNEVTRKKPKP